MRSISLLLFLFFIGFSSLQAQGHRLEISIDGFEGDTLYMGYYLMDKQYLQDTAGITDQGTFVFEGEEEYAPGLYIVVLPPNNDFFQLILNKGEQNMRIKGNMAKLGSDVKFEGEGIKDNQLMYDYVNKLASLRPVADEKGKKMAELAEGSPEKAKLQKELEDLNKEVTAYQDNIIDNYPNSFTAALILSGRSVEVPEFEATGEDLRVKQYVFSRDHYFDNIKLDDARLLRSPFLFQKVDFFVNKYHVQHPDTLSQAIDKVLTKMEPSEETFKYYLIHFLNAYAKSKLVGMDAVYVHLVEKYYAAGKAPWTEEEQLKKIVDNATKLKPLLIGKTAPDFNTQKQDGSKVALHDVDSEYTILYFWRYDCGHCKKSTPIMKEFHDKYKAKGVKIFAVCAKFTDEVPACWDYINDNEINDWIHVVDPYLRSKFMDLYDIESTPQIYVLDKDKKILSKKIGAEQLEELMDNIIKMKEEESKSRR
ncbi:MAG: redoxin domain-containing protein [Bacteroidota bacterium]